jgi:hypothetical protein
MVRTALLDGGGALSARVEAGPGRSPSVAPLAGGDLLLLAERAGRLSLGRLAATGALAPLAAPPGRAGVVAATDGGALLCAARPSERADGDEIRCVRYRGSDRRDEVDVASGAVGLQALGAATTGDTTALAWQQDNSDGRGMVAVALVRCR